MNLKHYLNGVLLFICSFFSLSLALLSYQSVGNVVVLKNNWLTFKEIFFAVAVLVFRINSLPIVC